MTDDEAHARIIRESARALGEWVTGAKIWNKRLCDLTEFQITNMMTAALSQAVVTRAEIQVEESGQPTAESPYHFAL